MALPENNTENCREILNDFLERWSIGKIKRMTLPEYVNVKDPDTFTQWLDTLTDDLGSIRGYPSNKFGIFKRGSDSGSKKILLSDDQYSWRKKFGETRQSAYYNIRKQILDVILLSQSGNFEAIDNIELHQWVKWKIAYLYSNERLIPIYKNEILVLIAKHLGMKDASKSTQGSALQRLMIEHKPPHLSIYDYAHQLWYKFSGKEDKKRRGRKAATGRNTNDQKRKVRASTYIAKQIHNELQLSLQKILIEKYGPANVIMEKDFVDIKVLLPGEIQYYEVKSASYAGDCIKEALGQVLDYVHIDIDKRKKQIFVVGSNNPNTAERTYLKYIQKVVTVPIDYIQIDRKVD